MMYKLFYDTLPGNRVSYETLTKLDENFRKSLWTVPGHIHHFMNTLGIEFSWTSNINDPDVVVIVEIDSADATVTKTVLEYASKTYKKSIVVSPTEPPPADLFLDTLKELYPNVLYVCLGDHKFKHDLKNFALFPFLLIRSLSLSSNINLYHFNNCNFLTSKKQYMFNHLSNFWSPNKYHMHYTIKNYFQHATNSNPILSYKPINWPSNKNIARLNSNIKIFESMKEWILEINKSPIFSSLYPYEDYISRADTKSIDHYRIEQVNGDRSFDVNNLYHPATIYKDSYISVVTEVVKGRIEYNPWKSVAYNYISEKTLQPILHGHIFVVNAPDNYSTKYLRDTLGFELYDEIFDYNDIEDTYVPKCENSSEYYTAYKIISQLNNFTPDLIFDNAKLIAEKIQYNKSVLTNSNSKLRQDLKHEFIKILETYRDMNNE